MLSSDMSSEGDVVSDALVVSSLPESESELQADRPRIARVATPTMAYEVRVRTFIGLLLVSSPRQVRGVSKVVRSRGSSGWVRLPVRPVAAADPSVDALAPNLGHGNPRPHRPARWPRHRHLAVHPPDAPRDLLRRRGAGRAQRRRDHAGVGPDAGAASAGRSPSAREGAAEPSASLFVGIPGAVQVGARGQVVTAVRPTARPTEGDPSTRVSGAVGPGRAATRVAAHVVRGAPTS
ncbi:hypothetical protein NKG05_17355 [Oerskovia sp. M15]